MAKVKYKKSLDGINRMVVKVNQNSRPSLGMTEVKGEIYYLSPEVIISYKNQARKEINKSALAELATSIQSQGIIQPLQLIPSISNEGKFEVVSGERRLRAAKIIGLDVVPCMILNRDRDAEEIALIENIQREDLHPIELADAVAKLLHGTKHGSQTEAAERLGVSKSQISHLLAISRLPEDVRKYLVLKRDIKIDFLKKIAYLKDEKCIRDKVFNSYNTHKKYRDVLRVSFNGELFRFDRLKIEKLSSTEKNLFRDELLNLLKKLDE